MERSSGRETMHFGSDSQKYCGQRRSIWKDQTKTCGFQRLSRKWDAIGKKKKTRSGSLCFGLHTRLEWLPKLTTGNQNLATKTLSKSREWTVTESLWSFSKNVLNPGNKYAHCSHREWSWFAVTQRFIHNPDSNRWKSEVKKMTVRQKCWETNENTHRRGHS